MNGEEHLFAPADAVPLPSLSGEPDIMPALPIVHAQEEQSVSVPKFSNNSAIVAPLVASQAMRCVQVPLPKRPTGAFFYYQNQHRHALRIASPDLENCDLSKKLAESWKMLTAVEKEPYLRMHEADQQRYNAECERLGITPPAQRKRNAQQLSSNGSLVQVPVGHVQTDGAGGISQPAPGVQMPKARRPTPAFIYFQNHHRQALREASPELSHVEISKKLGMVWRQMDAEQKQPYLSMHASDRNRYMKERDALESIMMGGQVPVPQHKRPKTEPRHKVGKRGQPACVVDRAAINLALETQLPAAQHHAPAELNQAETVVVPPVGNPIGIGDPIAVVATLASVHERAPEMQQELQQPHQVTAQDEPQSQQLEQSQQIPVPVPDVQQHHQVQQQESIGAWQPEHL
jgi:hypothetical protein